MSEWSTPDKSMDSQTVSSSATGATVKLGRVCSDHAVQWNMTWVTGDQLSVSLQGSMDGAGWYDIGASYTTGPNPVGGPNSVSVLAVASAKPASHVRAVASSSAGAPVVTALVTSRQ